MSWVNLDDVYVNKSGDSIAGNLSVGGTLTINDGKGTDTTYNVANEITTLRDSVSPLHQYPGNVPGDVKSQTWYVMPIGGNKVVLCFEVVPWYLSLTNNEYYYKASIPIKIKKVLFSCSESTQWRCDRTRVMIEEDSPTEIQIAAKIDRNAPNGTVEDPYLIPIKVMIIATI